MISIIIPVFNEAKIIEETLKQLQDYSNIEIIVVDGGSKDQTQAIVTKLRLENTQIKLIESSSLGRGFQMNCGAAVATGNIFLFLHADTILPSDYQQIIQDILKHKNTIVGAFQLKINEDKKSLKSIERMVNLRSHILSLPYGDQGFFITKDNFNRLGGFANLPIMEDFDFIQRSKGHGKVTIANCAVVTSARRWQKLGVIKTTLVNQLIILGYFLKISPHKLRKFYRNFDK